MRFLRYLEEDTEHNISLVYSKETYYLYDKDGNEITHSKDGDHIWESLNECIDKNPNVYLNKVDEYNKKVSFTANIECIQKKLK